jgi:hypothetical protein
VIRPKAPVPVETVVPERDPTADAAAYLKREAANVLSECAPSTGARVRIHLEIEVHPSGAVKTARITNVDPFPSELGACVDRKVRTLVAPPFDAAAPEVFALTVLL